MNEIKVSAAPVVKLTRVCDNCAHALEYTNENTRKHHVDALGVPCEVVGRYLDCPRQSCRHANRVPGIVENVPAAPAPRAPVVSPVVPAMFTVDAAKHTSVPDFTDEGANQQDCACVTSVGVSGPSSGVFYDKTTSHMFSRRKVGKGERAFFAKVGCRECDGSGRVDVS